MNLAELTAKALYYLQDARGSLFKRPEVTSAINEALEDVHRTIQDAGEGYYLACVDCTVAAADTDWEFELPTDFSEISHVERVSGTTTRTMEMTPFSRRTRFVDGQHYYIRGNKIGIHRPGASFTMRVHYVTTTVLLVDDADEPDVPRDFHSLIALRAAAVLYATDQRQLPDTFAGLMHSRERDLRRYIEGRSSGDSVVSARDYEDGDAVYGNYWMGYE